MTEDIRWIQRFDNFKRALKQLEMAFGLFEQSELNDLEKQGFIQAFEYNFELAWNVIKNFTNTKASQIYKEVVMPLESPLSVV